jgi:hypothetical protein
MDIFVSYFLLQVMLDMGFIVRVSRSIQNLYRVLNIKSLLQLKPKKSTLISSVDFIPSVPYIGTKMFVIS